MSDEMPVSRETEKASGAAGRAHERIVMFSGTDLHDEEPPWPVKDERGKRYGKLVAIKYAGLHKGNAYFLYQCDCGNKKVIRAKEVRRGSTKSCGCIRRGRRGAQISCNGNTYPSRNAFAEANANGDNKKKARILDRLKRGYTPEAAIAADKGSRKLQRMRQWPDET